VLRPSPVSILRSKARRLGVALFFLSPAALLACGASIQAVYEGDVRFEHCMALDARPDVKPTIRRACWEEWVTFYTFGQTRDRIDYAQMREQQLSTASDFDEGEWEPVKSSGPSAVPEPTSALAPPPMLLATDGGTESVEVDAGTDAADADTSHTAVEHAPPSADCAAECEQAWNFCRKDCKAAPCEKSCAGKYKRCMKRCF